MLNISLYIRLSYCSFSKHKNTYGKPLYQFKVLTVYTMLL